MIPLVNNMTILTEGSEQKKNRDFSSQNQIASHLIKQLTVQS